MDVFLLVNAGGEPACAMRLGGGRGRAAAGRRRMAQWFSSGRREGDDRPGRHSDLDRRMSMYVDEISMEWSPESCQ
jgi:hypothetical protein